MDSPHHLIDVAIQALRRGTDRDVVAGLVRLRLAGSPALVALLDRVGAAHAVEPVAFSEEFRRLPEDVRQRLHPADRLQAVALAIASGDTRALVGEAGTPEDLLLDLLGLLLVTERTVS